MYVEWIDNDQLVIYTITNATRPAIDALITSIEETRTRWDKSKPLFSLYDVSSKDVLLTPYMREQMMKLADTMPPDLRGAYAVVLPTGIFSTIIQVFVRVFSQRREGVNSAMFQDRDSAISWLREQMKQQHP